MTKDQKIYQVDAFTNQEFKGNPAGVMLLSEPLSEAKMQAIAMEMNLSETAFVQPFNKHYLIRYFTPTTEIPLCGHATLASAHILYELGLVQQQDIIEFHAETSILHVKYNNGWIEMNFPEFPTKPIEIPRVFKQIVGFQPTSCHVSSNGWTMAVADTQKEIENAAPDYQSMTPNGLGHLIVTAPASTPNFDFVVRCFAPQSGISEDPVTGSAHSVLTPFWSDRLEKKQLSSLQVSPRTGQLQLEMLQSRVLIKGQAITIFEANWKV